VYGDDWGALGRALQQLASLAPGATQQLGQGAGVPVIMPPVTGGELQGGTVAGGAPLLPPPAAGGSGGSPVLPGGLAAAQLQALLFQAQGFGPTPHQPPPPPGGVSVGQVQTMLHMLGEQQKQVFLQAQARGQQQQAPDRLLGPAAWTPAPAPAPAPAPVVAPEARYDPPPPAAAVRQAPRVQAPQEAVEAGFEGVATLIRSRLEAQISALCSDLSLPEAATRAVMAAHLFSSPNGLKPGGNGGETTSFSPASAEPAEPAGPWAPGIDEGPLARAGGVELAAALAAVLRKQKQPSTHKLKKTGNPGRWAVRASPAGEAAWPSGAKIPGEDSPVMTRVRCDSCKVVLQMEVPRGPVKELRLRCGNCNCLLEVALPPNFREELKRLNQAQAQEAATPPAQAAHRDSAPISEREREGIDVLLELAGGSSEETTSDRPLAEPKRQPAARADARREGNAKKAKKDEPTLSQPAVRTGRGREEHALTRGQAAAEPAAKKPKAAPEAAAEEPPAKEPKTVPEVAAEEPTAEKPKAAPEAAAEEPTVEKLKAAPEAAAGEPRVEEPKAALKKLPSVDVNNAGGVCPPLPPRGSAAGKLKAAEAATAALRSLATAGTTQRRLPVTPAPISGQQDAPAMPPVGLQLPSKFGATRAGKPSGSPTETPQVPALAHSGPLKPVPRRSDRSPMKKLQPALTWTPDPERERPGWKPPPKQ